MDNVLSRRPGRALFLACLLTVITCAHAKPPAPPTESVFRQLQADASGSWLEDDGAELLAKLPVEARTEVATRALADPQPRVRLVGLQLMYELGPDERADAAAAGLLADGVDITGLGWAWMHSGAPRLMERRLDGIAAALRDRYDTLDAGQRRRADAFLCSRPGATCAPASMPAGPGG